MRSEERPIDFRLDFALRPAVAAAVGAFTVLSRDIGEPNEFSCPRSRQLETTAILSHGSMEIPRIAMV